MLDNMRNMLAAIALRTGRRLDAPRARRMRRLNRAWQRATVVDLRTGR